MQSSRTAHNKPVLEAMTPPETTAAQAIDFLTLLHNLKVPNLLLFVQRYTLYG